MSYLVGEKSGLTSVEKNILVLRQDSETSWKWIAKILEDLDKIKKDQEVAFKLIENICKRLNEETLVDLDKFSDITNV